MTHNPDNSYSKVGIPSSAKGGFVQQTFLGASIVDFNINAGFGEELLQSVQILFPTSLIVGMLWR